ncbi:MAG: hypothetical protein V9E89_18355 [Ilumatobacteraceae bacterium]
MRRTLAGVIVVLAGGLTACAGTTYDPNSARPTTPPSTTTTLPTGSPGELLRQLATATQGLEAVIQRQGDAAGAIATITALWAAVSAHVGAADPGMASGFDGAIRLAQRAAASRQLGYAVRAGKSVTALVTAFLAAHPAPTTP